MTQSKFLLVILILLLIISAFSVIYVRDYNRRLFIHEQKLSTEQQQYEIEWGKLLLEQSTWASQSRVQRIAEQQLHMFYPRPKDVNVIKLYRQRGMKPRTPKGTGSRPKGRELRFSPLGIPHGLAPAASRGVIPVININKP